MIGPTESSIQRRYKEGRKLVFAHSGAKSEAEADKEIMECQHGITILMVFHKVAGILVVLIGNQKEDSKNNTCGGQSKI